MGFIVIETERSRYGIHGGIVPAGANPEFYHERFNSDVYRYVNGTMCDVIAVNKNGAPQVIWEIMGTHNGFSNEFTYNYTVAFNAAAAGHEVREFYDYSRIEDGCHDYGRALRRVINPTRATRRLLQSSVKYVYTYKEPEFRPLGLAE